MRLVHFSEKKNITRKKYTPKKGSDSISGSIKPHGLWVSDEDDFGWKKWCEGEQFRLEGLKHAHEIKLKEDSKILFVKNEKELEEFNEKYGSNSEFAFIRIIDWNRIKSEGYQGIIITPYLWSKRLDHNVFWYYGWDCASGCIWDMDCIEEIKYDENNSIQQAKLEKV